mgnify:CR=1 FL=1
MSIKKPDDWERWEFENAKMRRSLPQDIVPSESTENDDFLGFILSIGMVFNDFKGLVLLNDTMLLVYKSEPVEINEHFGERAGILIQLTRMLYSTVYEVFVLIRDSTNIINSKRFQQLLQRTPANTQLVWEMLAKIANGEDVDDGRFDQFVELKNLLVQARNNIGFHYQTRGRLIEGFRRFFFTGISTAPPETREWSLRSIRGTAFALSRYYYVDAAVQGYYVNLFGDEKLAQQRNEETFELVNLIVYTIHDILAEYHSSLPGR